MPNSTPRNWLYIDVFGSNSHRWTRWSLLAASLAISAQAKADYRVNVGDVLEVTVGGVPELRQHAPVQIDGSISLPLVGLLPVAGLPVPEIRAKIGQR